MNFFERMSQNPFGAKARGPFADPVGRGTIFHEPNSNVEGPWVDDEMPVGQQSGNFFDQFDEPEQGPIAQPPIPEPVTEDSSGPAPAMGVPDVQEGSDITVTGRRTPSYGPQGSRAPLPEMDDANKARYDDGQRHVAEIGRLIDSGATVEQVEGYITANNLSGVTGVREMIAYRDAHGGRAIVVGEGQENLETVKQPEVSRNEATGLGFADSALLGGYDELRGAGQAATNSVANVFGMGTGESFGDVYERERDDVRRQLHGAQDQHGGYYLGGQIAGGLATAPILPGAALGRGVSLGGRVLRGAGEGAAYGGVYGWNSGEGDFGQRLEGAGSGAGMGLVLGGTLGGATSVIANATNRGAAAGKREILDAADRLNNPLNHPVPDAAKIQPLVGHLSDGGTGAMLTNVAESSSWFGGPVRRSVQKLDDNAEAARDRIAGQAGWKGDDLDAVATRHADPNQHGTIASYEAASKQWTDGLYGQAEQLAGDVRLTTPRTVAAIDKLIRTWKAVPGGVAGSQSIASLRKQLARGQFTVDGLRRLRTSFGDNLDSNNRTAQEGARTLWKHLSEDITMGLSRQGKSDAAKAYRKADESYQNRAENMKIVESLLGKNPDRLADRLASMSRRDYTRLSKFMDDMRTVFQRGNADEIRGALIADMGRAPAGKQNADGNAFSLETFLTQWNDKNFPEAAKKALFPRHIIRDLDDLATVAGSNRTFRSRGNGSQSAYRGMNIYEINTALAGAASVATGNPAFGGAALIKMALASGGAHLLASPGVARALVKWAEGGTTETVFKRLSEAARRSPAASAGILGLRDTIAGHGANPGINVPEQGVEAEGEANAFDEFDTTQPTEFAPVNMGSSIPGQDAVSVSASDGSDTFGRMLTTESNNRQFDRNGRPLTSSAGAIGVAQVMPATAREVAEEMGIEFDDRRYRTDPEYNAALGRFYYDKMLRRYGGDDAKAVAAYNAGPGGVDRAVARSRRSGQHWTAHLPQETKGYLAKVLDMTVFGGGGRSAPVQQAWRTPNYFDQFDDAA